MPVLRTPIRDLFDIEVPIFAAGMGGVTFAPLAGAVSAAGGLGVLGATFHTPEGLREEIRAVRRITDRPFGVGLMVPNDIPDDLAQRNIPPFPDFLADLLPEVAHLKGEPPPALTLELAKAQVAVVLEQRVPVLSSGLGTPEWLVEAAHAAGTKIISLVGSARQAVRLAQIGVDCIVAQGMEAGGHVGTVTSARRSWRTAIRHPRCCETTPACRRMSLAEPVGLPPTPPARSVHLPGSPLVGRRLCPCRGR